ncbi:hypothetical protein [Photobacterium leiognathi]|uniref:hypothetical protein n=1 Tax=Photobacterium leiognathi TaxID=553611 RepID=UPI002980A441|nr:hypothetical protein [Photobacterium leiognathi]
MIKIFIVLFLLAGCQSYKDLPSIDLLPEMSCIDIHQLVADYEQVAWSEGAKAAYLEIKQAAGPIAMRKNCDVVL